ncbi:TNT domain-containing protein [Lentzea sp. CA-135723]|uniref:TNT domain-containing protein n=1 Tax=Lentzea sp. CA-135723 TaxID=3239950 RepID=UPI003D8AD1AD
MGIELPAELTAIAAKAGVTWPKADEDAMRSSATAWREAGDKIKSLGTTSDGAANRALGGVTGSTGDAARGRWAKVVAPDGDFQRAAKGCHAAADRLEHAAVQVGAAKVQIVRELVTLAKNNDAATASANAGNPGALAGLDTLTKGAAANVANLNTLLTSAIRLDSGIDMSQGTSPVNTAPGAHGPGGTGGGVLSPITDIVGGMVTPVAGVVTDVAAPVTNAAGTVLAPVASAVAPVVAPVAGAVAPVVAPVAAVVAPVTEAVAPVAGAVTAPVAPVVAPVVGAVGDAAAPIVHAAAPVTGPVTAPVAGALHPMVDTVPGGRDAAGPVFGDGPGNGPGNAGDQGRGPAPLPGLVPNAAQPVVAPVAHAVVDAIPSVHGTLGPVADGTTQASGAVLDPPLIRGGELPGQTVSSAPAAAAPAAPAAAAPAGPAMGSPIGGAPVGGPVGGPIGGALGAAPVSGAVSGVPAAAAQSSALVGQQAPGQQAQQGQAAQQAQQAAKSADAKSADPKAAEAKAGELRSGSGELKQGAPAAAAKSGAQMSGAQVLPGTQATTAQFGGQSGSQPGPQGQTSAQAQTASGAVPAKDATTKDLSKDTADTVLDGDLTTVDNQGERQLGDTIATPAAPGADVDLGARPTGHTPVGGAATAGPMATTADFGTHSVSHALSDRLENRDDLAFADPGLAGEIARHTYTAAAAGSWFMAIFLSAGKAPRLAPRPARQLPPPPQAPEEQPVPRFAPGDHLQALDLVAQPSTAQAISTPAPPSSEGLGADHPAVQALLEGHDPLAGMHERDWEALFQHEDGTPRWPAEREGGYEDSQAEVLKAGAELDRFGTPEGRVLSAAGTPFAQRSLPPAAAAEGYRVYRVEKDLPVHRTISAPWFGQPGGGSRYRTTYPVADLVALGYLTEITA